MPKKSVEDIWKQLNASSNLANRRSAPVQDKLGLATQLGLPAANCGQHRGGQDYTVGVLSPTKVCLTSCQTCCRFSACTSVCCLRVTMCDLPSRCSR